MVTVLAAAINSFVLFKVLSVLILVVLHVDFAVARNVLVVLSLVSLAVCTIIRIISYLFVRVLILIVIIVSFADIRLCLVSQLQLVRTR